MKKPYFVLRHVGSSDFASRIPHDFDERNMLPGWQLLAQRGALVYATEEEAKAAKDSDPDGYSFMVEEIWDTENA